MINTSLICHTAKKLWYSIVSNLKYLWRRFASRFPQPKTDLRIVYYYNGRLKSFGRWLKRTAKNKNTNSRRYYKLTHRFGYITTAR